MKIRHIIITIAAAVLLVLALQSCSLFGTSIDARIDMFEDDLNNTDRSGAYTNFHPDTDQYATAAIINGFWSTSYIAYDIYDRDISGDTVTAQLAGYGGAGYGPVDIQFNMKKDGLSDWKIYSIEMPPGNQIIP